MTITTVQTALTAQSVDDIRAEILADLAARGADANGFGPYSVQRLLVERQASAEAGAQALRVDVTTGGFGGTAAAVDPTWLDRNVKGQYQIDRIPALKAVRTFRLTNTASGGPYTFVAGDLIAATDIVLDDGSALTFRNSNDAKVTLLGGNGQTVDLDWTADQAGLIGNSGTPTKLVTGIPGVTISNVALVTAGADVEADDAYLARGQSRWGTLGYGGSSGAYLYLVRQAAPSVTRVGVRDDNPRGPGTVDLYLANSAGPASDPELALVSAALAPLKALGFPPVGIFKALAHSVAVVGTLYTNGSNGAATSNAITKLATLASTFPVGSGTLFIEVVRSTLMAVKGATNCVLSSPPDTTLLADEVLTIDSSGLVVT